MRWRAGQNPPNPDFRDFVVFMLGAAAGDFYEKIRRKPRATTMPARRGAMSGAIQSHARRSFKRATYLAPSRREKQLVKVGGRESVWACSAG